MCVRMRACMRACVYVCVHVCVCSCIIQNSVHIAIASLHIIANYHNGSFIHGTKFSRISQKSSIL